MDETEGKNFPSVSSTLNNLKIQQETRLPTLK
jgi:hypothetical protein